MKNTKKFLLSLLIFSITSSLLSTSIEITQSTPIGTILSSKKIRSTQSVWVEMINNAKETIDIGSLFFENKKGEAMEPVVKALKQAASRNVKIRMIFDAMFHKLYPDETACINDINNIEIRFMPINECLGGVMHAKYMIVDNENSYVGSENFAWTELSQVHNIGIRIKNKELASTIQVIFDLDWEFCKTGNILGNSKILYRKFKNKPVTEQRPITIGSDNELSIVHPAFSPESITPPGINQEQEQFIKLLNNAQEEIVMQVMTYLPAKGYGLIGYWPALDNAIRAAATRGVKVKFIVSNWNNLEPNISYMKSLALIPNIEIKISTIPEYKNQFIPYTRVEHCKYFVVDNNLAWVGTGNWEWSYFHNTRDIAIIVKGSLIAEQLKDIFFKDWNGPYVEKIDVTKNYKMPKVN